MFVSSHAHTRVCVSLSQTSITNLAIITINRSVRILRTSRELLFRNPPPKNIFNQLSAMLVLLLLLCLYLLLHLVHVASELPVFDKGSAHNRCQMLQLAESGMLLFSRHICAGW